MIISASRRCDIPNYKSDWFLDGLQKGEWVVPKNLFTNYRIRAKRETIDCIVFWTKNPEPMLARLHELDGIPYYFQFTLTGYSQKIEPGVPEKHHMLQVFQTLSDRTSPKQVIWRYDPIAISPVYTVEYHKQAFRQIAEALDGKTERCVISFLDVYGKVQSQVASVGMRAPTVAEITELCEYMAEVAEQHGIAIETCSEKIDLRQYGILPTHCIDAALIQELTGREIAAAKDPSQRIPCGCCRSVDVGTYHTCKNNCIYCYAN